MLTINIGVYIYRYVCMLSKYWQIAWCVYNPCTTQVFVFSLLLLIINKTLYFEYVFFLLFDVILNLCTFFKISFYFDLKPKSFNIQMFVYDVESCNVTNFCKVVQCSLIGSIIYSIKTQVYNSGYLRIFSMVFWESLPMDVLQTFGECM